MFSIQKHIKEHRIKLGKSIQGRKKIYLDTKYWGLLCDVSLGIEKDEISIEIYNTLMKFSKEKKIICPLSYRMHIELRKHKDIKRLNETAKIMNILSDGVMIISEDERINYELFYFLYKTINGKDSAYEPDIFIWSKAIFVVGATIPEDLAIFSVKENEYIQKEFFKQMWEYSFVDLIYKMGIETNTEILETSKNTVDSINIDKVRYEHENKSYKQVYMSEIAGSLDVYKNKIKNTFNKLATTMTESTEELGDSPIDDIQPIINMFYNLFKKNKLGTYLPSFDVGAMAHATIRWNKTKKFEKNDLDDIGHTYTALPYYDYFFTERSFYTLIIQSKYNDKYSCIVAWQKREILDIIKFI